MPTTIFGLVLAAALIDALQHCLIKSGPDSYGRALVVAMAGGVLALPGLVVTGLPDAAAWPWLALSVAIGSLNWLVLGWAYQTGALALVFPLSRGAGVALTTWGAWVFLDQRLSLPQTATVAVVLCGLALVALSGLTRQALSLRALLPSAMLALVIAAFTLVDAAGVQRSASPLAYCLALYLGNGVVIAAYALTRHARRLRRLGPTVLAPATASAAFSITAYALILFAITRAPVATVAAVAETSIVFAAVLGLIWLREPTRASHGLGVAVVACGVVFLRLAP